jgi:hypothetical protein
LKDASRDRDGTLQRDLMLVVDFLTFQLVTGLYSREVPEDQL